MPKQRQAHIFRSTASAESMSSFSQLQLAALVLRLRTVPGRVLCWLDGMQASCCPYLCERDSRCTSFSLLAGPSPKPSPESRALSLNFEEMPRSTRSPLRKLRHTRWAKQVRRGKNFDEATPTALQTTLHPVSHNIPRAKRVEQVAVPASWGDKGVPRTRAFVTAGLQRLAVGDFGIGKHSGLACCHRS